MTVDLFLQKNNVWGDYARTIVIKDGKVTGDVEDIYYFEKVTNIIDSYLCTEKIHLLFDDYVYAPFSCLIFIK